MAILTPSPSETVVDLTGATVGPFATQWKYGAAEEVRAYLERGGVRAPDLTRGPDFTVTGTNPLTSGGSVSLSGDLLPPGGWSAGDRLVLYRFTPKRQPLALPDTEGHKPSATEAQLDRIVRSQQEADDRQRRALTTRAGEPGQQIPTAEARRGRVMGFRDTETAEPVAVPNTSAAVAEDLALAAEAREGAEVAKEGAEQERAGAAEERTAAEAAQAGAAEERELAQQARDGAVLSAAEAASYLNAFPANVIYDTEAAGRAAVANGAHFWVRGTDGIQSYRKADAGSSVAGPIIPSLTQVRATQPVVECVITNAGSLVTFTPKPGYTVVPGSGQTFTGKSSFTNTGNIYAEVIGLNDGDYRQVTPPGATELPSAAVREDETFEIGSPTPAGRFNLLSAFPAPKPPASYIIVLQMTDGGPNDWVLTPTTPLPNDTGALCTFRFQPPNKGPGPVTLRILGINDLDPWYLLGPNGDPEADQLVATDIWTSADELEFSRIALDVVNWRLKRVLNPTLAKVGTVAAGGDPYLSWAGAQAAALNFAGSFA